ncbi:hypothetical protein L249_5203 [Ophiocordyceps polyrhachis-furcata BCC 54312]|uniref:Hydrophobin n=1 Tax=Ophiocordyceps polyrhachis-furcata BCC 54312 TaxID=1330021 RepID=A0A367L8Z1_9HYPO|nr:hypothetical protein L249_5203 [Ophiocordyceps polyrhachis-furcata BCC 54312]
MKCFAALSVLALAIGATAAPLEDNRYDDRFENKGFEAKGYEAKSYEAKGYEARGYDNGYRGRGRGYERGLENYYGPGYGYGPGNGHGRPREYKRAVQDKQAGYDRHWAPYHGRDYDGDYIGHERYDPTGDYEDNFNGNSRDTIGNSRDVVGNRGDTNGNRGDVCSAKSQQQVCCNGGLSCLVQLLGAPCETTAYCCDTHSGPGTAVNLNLLNCLKLH